MIGDGVGTGPGDGPGDGGDGPGDGGAGPGDGGGEASQLVLNHTHPKFVHSPSLDCEDVPVLQFPEFGHQPQAAAEVHRTQDVLTAHSSEAGGEGGGDGGEEPLAKAVQLKTDKTESVVQIELSAAQLLLMVLKRVLAVMYWREDTVAGTMLQPNDNVAVPSLALAKEMSTA